MPHTDTRRGPSAAQPLRLGTRRSPLAMAQAEEVRTRLAAAHGWPLEAISIVPVLAMGDKVIDRPLSEIGGKAVWTKELDGWLLGGEIDLAVHSAKDVESWRPEGLVIAAFLAREDVRDVLLGAASIADLPPGARVGTSAPRRAAQLLHQRPDCTVVSFRGNVATRMGRLAAGEAEATLLAMAGLNRLGLAEGTPLAVDDWLPAPSQGAIAIETRTDDTRLRGWLAAIDDADTAAAVRAERALLAALGGNCHSAVAAHAVAAGEEVHLRAALFSPDGAHRVTGEARFARHDAAGPQALAADLLARAPAAVTHHFSGADPRALAPPETGPS